MIGVMELADRYGFRCANIFHAGDGNLHPNIMFDPQVEGSTERVLELGGEIMRLCVDAGGSISGEHGVGLEKRSYMSWIFGEHDLDAQERVHLLQQRWGGLRPVETDLGHVRDRDGLVSGHLGLTFREGAAGHDHAQQEYQ